MAGRDSRDSKYFPFAGALPPDLRAEMAAVRRRLDDLARPVAAPEPPLRAIRSPRVPPPAPRVCPPAPVAESERRRVPRADITIAPGWGERTVPGR